MSRATPLLALSAFITWTGTILPYFFLSTEWFIKNIRLFVSIVAWEIYTYAVTQQASPFEDK